MFDGLMTEQEQDTLSSFLERAMHLIEDPRHWCQQDFNRRLDGVWQYCALGALDCLALRRKNYTAQAEQTLGGRAEVALNWAAAQMGFAADAALLNDMLGHKAVMEMYRRAIETARQKETVLLDPWSDP